MLAFEERLLAHVLLRGPDGREHELVPGDVIGRLWTAAMPLDDGRVSEAHALVSLREGRLWLIALRGGLAVDGQAFPQVALHPGVRVQLARGLEVEAVEVWLPEVVLGLEGPGLVRQVLPSVASLVGPPMRLVVGWREDALAHVWSTGEGWTAREKDTAARPVAPNDRLLVAGQAYTFVGIPLAAAGNAATRRKAESPLRIVTHYDTVYIHRDGEPTVVLGGRPARLLSELVSFDGPVGWSVLSEALWPDEPDPNLRRSRLDVVLSRVRAKLRASGVRPDLVRADGAGSVGLVLGPGDTYEDRS